MAQKKTFIVLGIVVVLLVLLGARALKQKRAVQETPNQFVGGISDQQAQKIAGVTIDPRAQQQINRDKAVSTMQQKLPYKGSYFTLAFNSATWNFVLTISAAYQQQGNQEFDLFLRANGIDDRSWLGSSLQIVVQ